MPALVVADAAGRVADLLFDLLLVRGKIYAEVANFTAIGMHQPQNGFEGRCFAGAVAADKSQRFALVNGQIHAVQRHKGFSEQAGISADLYIGVFLAAHTAPPALQIGRQCAAADLAQFILFF